MSFFRMIIFIIFIFNIFGCVEKTRFYGKILNKEDLNFNSLDRQELLRKFGAPSYEDKLLNKYFYFTKMSKGKNFYINNVEYDYLFVFEINQFGKIINTETIDLLKNKNHRYKKIITNNNVIKRGLLEKVFGGIGKNQLPNSQ